MDAKDYYNLETQEVMRSLNTSDSAGLTSGEARKRLEEYGYNQLVSRHKKTFFQSFVTQFKGLMILILLIAAVISGIVVS